MVQINLLPSTGEKVSKAELKIKLKPLVFVLIGLMLTIIIAWVKLGMQLTAGQNRLAKVDEELQSVKSTLQSLDRLKEEKDTMIRRMDFFQKQLQREVLWAEDLNRLSNLVPAGIWLESLVLHTEGNRYVKLDINGSAISLEGEEMIDLISGFMTALKQDAVFAKQFSEIKLVSSQMSRSEKIEIMHFKLFCQFR